MSHLRSLAPALAFSFGLTACGSSSQGGSHACDPLTTEVKPVNLGHVLGLGKDDQGVVYLADDENDGRVFVSSGDTLVRRRIAGSGESSQGDTTTYLFSYEDGAQTRSLEVVTRGGKAVSMRAFDTDVGKGAASGGRALALLDSTTVKDFTLKNLPGTIVIEYLADAPAGKVLLVTRPEDDWTYQDFRVFYGPKAAVSERPLTNATRALDGGSTWIDFDVDGEDAEAYFPVVSINETFKPGPATLALGGKTLPLTLDTDTPPSLMGLSFTCLR